MGIGGLIPFLKNDGSHSAIRKAHIREFRGKRAGVDAYSWLHRSIFCCALELFIGKPTNKFVYYCMKQVRLLLHCGVIPVLVFDGQNMPYKLVDQKRREDRRKAREQARALFAVGKRSEAYKFIVQAIDVTHEMAYKFMTAARELDIDCIVAPYEADAELAYLQKEKYIEVIVTEDSDLIVFGCSLIFYKMTANGEGELYERCRLELALKMKPVRFRHFKFDKFRHATVMSGCDYVKNLSGIGLMKAWKFMNYTDIEDIKIFLKKIPSYLRLKVTINKEYVKNFLNAEMSFLYQYVFDPIKREMVTFTEVQDKHKDDFKRFAGGFKPIVVDELQLALGNIDRNGRVYGNFSLFHVPENSIFKVKIAEYKPVTVICRKSVRFDTGPLQGVKRPIQEPLQERNAVLDDASIINLYKQSCSGISPKKEIPFAEPARKKPRKCKFVKCSKDEAVASSFFASDNKENNVSDTSDTSYELSELSDASVADSVIVISDSDSSVKSKATVVICSSDENELEDSCVNQLTPKSSHVYELYTEPADDDDDDTLTELNEETRAKSGKFGTTSEESEIPDDDSDSPIETLTDIIIDSEYLKNIEENSVMSDYSSEANQIKSNPLLSDEPNLLSSFGSLFSDTPQPLVESSEESREKPGEIGDLAELSPDDYNLLYNLESLLSSTETDEVLAELAREDEPEKFKMNTAAWNVKPTAAVSGKHKKREHSWKKEPTKGQTSILQYFSREQK